MKLIIWGNLWNLQFEVTYETYNWGNLWNLQFEVTYENQDLR